MVATLADDLTLAQAEFAYNLASSQTTEMNPFEVVYGRNPSNQLWVFSNRGCLTQESPHAKLKGP